MAHQSGTEVREYGSLGETVKETLTLTAAANGGSTPPVYTTRYDFDSFGRMLDITMPDGELVTNQYDSGGNVNHIDGTLNGRPYAYMERLDVQKIGDLIINAVQDQKQDQKNVSWSPHGYKHFASGNAPWKDVVKGTTSGPAKYLPDTNVEQTERDVFQTGTPVTNGKPWKVKEFENTIGASEGRESRWIRVEESGGTIHGHPISEREFRQLTKPKEE